MCSLQTARAVRSLERPLRGGGRRPAAEPGRRAVVRRTGQRRGHAGGRLGKAAHARPRRLAAVDLVCVRVRGCVPLVCLFVIHVEMAVLTGTLTCI